MWKKIYFPNTIVIREKNENPSIKYQKKIVVLLGKSEPIKKLSSKKPKNVIMFKQATNFFELGWVSYVWMRTIPLYINISLQIFCFICLDIFLSQLYNFLCFLFHKIHSKKYQIWNRKMKKCSYFISK